MNDEKKGMPRPYRAPPKAASNARGGTLKGLRVLSALEMPTPGMLCAARVLRTFGLKRGTLVRLVRTNKLTKYKFGLSKQASAYYSSEEIAALIKAMQENQGRYDCR